MNILIGIIGALLGGLFFYKSKANSAESLNKNVDTKEQVLDEERGIAKSTADIGASDSQIRTEQEKTKSEQSKELTNEELAKFFNDRKPN